MSTISTKPSSLSAHADYATTTADRPVILDLAANDAGSPGYVLAITSLGQTGTKGTAVLGTNGLVTYTPGAAFQYLAAGAKATDTFTYVVSDGHGGTATATATVTITGTWLPPTARPDTARTDAQHAVALNLLANDTDPQAGQTLGIAALNLAGTKGSVALGAGGLVTYTPGTAFQTLKAGNTATDSFAYTVTDGHGFTSVSTATVTITGVNTPPVANPDFAATDAAHGVWLGLTNNDTDLNNDPLFVSALDLTGTKGSLPAVVGTTTSGVFYTPSAAFAALSAGETAIDRFSYTVSDGHGGTATTTASVTVTGVNQAPTARNDVGATDASHSVVLNLAANDTDPNAHDVLRVSALNLTGTNGRAVINADGTVTYTPGAAFAGLAAGSSTSDSFRYTVSDGHGGTSTATVTVTVTAPGATAAAPAAFYVATNGNDGWSGRLAAPNAAGTDGPLASLRAAQLKMEASPATKTTYIEGGDYDLTSPLSLNSSDNGESWLAMPGQTPVIHGGQAITGWAQGANGIWTAKAPAGAFAAGGAVADLFINGTRETHARYPNAVPTDPVQGGWLTAAASLPGEATTRSFQFNPGDVPNFGSTAGLYVAVYQQNGWENFTLPVASINYATHTINLAGAAGMAIDQGSRYFIYNAASQLDAPGEWFYDPATNLISLKAPAGFTGAGVTVGSQSDIIQVARASNITIAGLTLTGSTSSGSGIDLTSSSNVILAGNTIADVGNGISLDGPGGSDDIEGNQISNTGNDGIRIYQGPSNLVIKGNSIHDIGQLLNGSGIWFTGSSNDVITNNLIRNTAAFGIGGGSVVGLADASYNDKISYNEVANANQTTSDGGGIYLVNQQQTSTGDVISYNTIYGTSAAGTAIAPVTQFLSPSKLFSFGIYLDDYAAGVTVQGNLLHDNLGGIDVHSGWNDLITGNEIVNSTAAALQNTVANWKGAGTHASTGVVFSNNLVSDAQPGAPLAVNEGDPSAAQWLHDFYNAAGLGSGAFVSATAGAYKVQGLAAWQAQGYDQGSMTGDAGLSAGSYALSAASAARAAGFAAPDVSRSGLSGFVATSPYDLFGR